MQSIEISNALKSIKKQLLLGFQLKHVRMAGNYTGILKQ